MPNTDRTGPRGEGAMTGQKMGRCSGNNTENARGFGRGFGRGQGRGGFRSTGGRGWGRGANFSSQESGASSLDAILGTLENILAKLDKSEK